MWEHLVYRNTEYEVLNTLTKEPKDCQDSTKVIYIKGRDPSTSMLQPSPTNPLGINKSKES